MTDDDKIVQPIGAGRYGNTFGTATGGVNLSSYKSIVSKNKPMEMGSKPTHGPRDRTPTNTIEDHDTKDESNTHPSRALVSRPVV